MDKSEGKTIFFKTWVLLLATSIAFSWIHIKVKRHNQYIYRQAMINCGRIMDINSGYQEAYALCLENESKFYIGNLPCKETPDLNCRTINHTLNIDIDSL